MRLISNLVLSEDNRYLWPPISLILSSFPHRLTHQVSVGYLLNKIVKSMYALQLLGFTFGYKLLGKLSKVNFRGLWFVIAKKPNKKTHPTFLVFY